MDEGYTVDIICLDFAKVFDSEKHRFLLAKMMSFDLGDIMGRRLIFVIRRSFQDLSKSACIPLCGALVGPHLEYGMPACSPSIVADITT